MKKKILVTVICALSLLAMYVYVSVPWGAAERGYWKVAWWPKCLYNFCKYQIPSEYAAVSYSEGAPNHRADKGLIILKNFSTGQRIFLLKLRELNVSLDQVVVDARLIKPLLMRTIGNSFSNDFNIMDYVPWAHFLIQKNIKNIPLNLQLKGIEIKEKEVYETPAAKVFYVRGQFQKIGFFKKMPFPRAFVTPVFDFTRRSEGAVAILKNKAADETIVAVSAIPLPEVFQEAVFKDFVASITFDGERYQPALLKGLSQEPEPKLKVKFSRL